MAKPKDPLYDPYKGVKSLLPVSTTSDKSLKNILSGLTSLQTSRAGIEALGGKPAKKADPGIISKAFDLEKGILTVPFRIATALVGEALGFPDEDLRKYNPIESAVRSARGEFAITGGDIFKVNSEDNFLVRLPKYIAALGFDIGLDPLTYVGGVGVFSRVGGARLLTDEKIATRILDDLLNITAQKGKSPQELVTVLANRRRLATSGKEIGDPKRLAALELGDVIGETFLTGSRGQVVKKLTNVLGDEDVARNIFARLPDEIRGGLFVRNPVTGRPIIRIAGGRGYTNQGIDAMNAWRTAIAGSRGGRAITRNLGGKVLGPGMAQVKYGLIDKNRKVLGDFARTRLSDITQLRSALTNRAHDIRTLPASFLKTADNINTSLSDLTPKQAKELSDSMVHFFHFNSDITDEAASELAHAGRRAADMLRQHLDEVADVLRREGVDIGYQENFVPMKYSDEEIEKLARLDPRQGPDVRDRYRGDLERKTFMEPVSVQELDDLNAAIRSQAMNPMQANEVMGRKVFETDPLKILSFYMDWATRTVANQRMVSALESTGVLLRFPSESLKILNVVNAKHYTGAVRKLTPEAVRRAQEAESLLVKELDDLVSVKTLRGREKQRKERINKAEQNYSQAKEQENLVRKQLVETDRAIKTLEPNVERLQKVLKGYGNLKLEAVREHVRNLRRSHARRSARLKANQASKMADTAEAKRFFELLEQRGGEVRIYSRGTGRLEDISIAPATKEEIADAKLGVKKAEVEEQKVTKDLAEESQTVRELEDEIDAMTSLIEDTSRTLSAAEVESFRDYVAALDRKRLLTAEYEGLRNNRRVAKRELDVARRDVTIPRSKGVQIVVDAYVTARRQYIEYSATLRNIPKDQLTPEQAARLQQLRGASRDARSIMNKTLGFAGSKTKQPGRAFAAEIVRTANQLTVQQVNTARIVADAEKLGDFIEKIGYAGASREAALQAMGDMMRSYRSIRRYVTKADLDLLNISERGVYEGLAEMPLYERMERRYTMRLDPLNADLRAAQIRNAPIEEIEALEKEIHLVEKLVLKDGFRIIGDNKQVKIPTLMKDVYSSAGVRDVMERMYRIETDPTEFQAFIAKIYDPLSLLWRTGATVGRGPAFTLTNLVGGLLNNFIGGVGYREHAIAAKVINTFRETIADTKRKLPNATERQKIEAAENAIRAKLSVEVIDGVSAVEIFEKFLESGAWWTTDTVFQMQELRRLGLVSGKTGVGQREQVLYKFEGEASTNAENAFRRVTNFMFTNPVQRTFSDLNQQAEIFMRFAAFTHGYQRFGSRDAALDMVRMLHFDYQDLSDAEKWLKRLVPFYTWTRHNVPLQIRASVLQQDKMRKIVFANAEAREALGVDDDDQWLNDMLPEFIDINSGFATYFKFGGNHLAVFPKLPMNDVDQMLRVSSIGGIPVPSISLQEASELLGPAITPLEFITQTNFDTGQSFRSNEEMVWQLSRSAIPYIGTAGRIVSAGTIPFTAAGLNLTVGGDSFGARVVNQFVAPDRNVSNLFNFLLGAPYGVTTLTERTLTGGIIQEGKVQSAQLRKLADEADVDVNWLREKIRSGATINELRFMIARGEGKKATVEREREARSTGPSRDYVSFVRSLQTGKGTGF